MKKIAQAAVTLLMVLFLSIGIATRAQDGGQGGGDGPKPPCRPPRICSEPLAPTPTPTIVGSTTNAAPQVGTVKPNDITVYSILFGLWWIIQLRLGT